MDIIDFFPLAMCLFCIIMGSVIASRCNCDIKNQAYIVYEGKFAYVPDGKNALIFIPDRSGVRLEVEKGIGD